MSDPLAIEQGQSNTSLTIKEHGIATLICFVGDRYSFLVLRDWSDGEIVTNKTVIVGDSITYASYNSKSQQADLTDTDLLQGEIKAALSQLKPAKMQLVSIRKWKNCLDLLGIKHSMTQSKAQS